MFKIYSSAMGGKFRKAIFLFFGGFFIVLGLLIILFPKVFAYAVAGVLILLGISLVAGAFTARRQPPRQPSPPEFSTYEEIRD